VPAVGSGGVLTNPEWPTRRSPPDSGRATDRLLRFAGCDGHPGDEVDVGGGDRTDWVRRYRTLQCEQVDEALDLFEALPRGVKSQGLSERSGDPVRIVVQEPLRKVADLVAGQQIVGVGADELFGFSHR
jgi:hypothetical protein